jgi:hypothetical protein
MSTFGWPARRSNCAMHAEHGRSEQLPALLLPACLAACLLARPPA